MLSSIENLFNETQSKSFITNICSPENLYAAWRKVRANRGAGGIDAVGIKDFERNLQDNLNELSRNLLTRTYQPLPVRFVQVMKANGKMRELGILTIRDRVAQRAVLDDLEPSIEAEMQDCNFAFRAGRNLEMAIQRILVARANGFWWTIESDIQDFFPSINREILLKDIRKITTDENILHLIELWVNAGILEETWWQAGQKKMALANEIIHEAFSETFENLIAQRLNPVENYGDCPAEYMDETEMPPFEKEKVERTKKREAVKNLLKEGFWLAMSHRTLIAKAVGVKTLGVGGLVIAGIALTPKVLEFYRQRFHPRKGILQGSPLSPVLANVYLTEFDKYFQKTETQLVRYCDDFVILCRSREDAERTLEAARRELAKKHLIPHPAKTRILSPTDEFNFLGYKFLTNGMVAPPPGATNEMANKIKEMSKKVSSKFQRAKTEFQVKKMTVKSWKDYFDIFGKR